MHIISSLFIIISLDSIDCDVPVHYYIFVIDSMYQYIYFEYEINKYIIIYNVNLHQFRHL